MAITYVMPFEYGERRVTFNYIDAFIDPIRVLCDAYVRGKQVRIEGPPLYFLNPKICKVTSIELDGDRISFALQETV
jgi:hypothetical protein